MKTHEEILKPYLITTLELVTKEDAIEAMREAVNQALDEAAENASVTAEEGWGKDLEFYFVDKDSILSLKEQVK